MMKTFNTLGIEKKGFPPTKVHLPKNCSKHSMVKAYKIPINAESLARTL